MISCRRISKGISYCVHVFLRYASGFGYKFMGIVNDECVDSNALCYRSFIPEWEESIAV